MFLTSFFYQLAATQNVIKILSDAIKTQMTENKDSGGELASSLQYSERPLSHEGKVTMLC